MNKLLLLLALAAGAATAHAQATDASGVPLLNKTLPPAGTAAPAAAPPAARRRTPRPPDQQAARQAQRLTQALGLSADQQDRVQQILLTQHQQQAANTRRAQQASRAQADEQLRQVLTADQYAHYQQLLAQRQQARQRRQLPGSLRDD